MNYQLRQAPEESLSKHRIIDFADYRPNNYLNERQRNELRRIRTFWTSCIMAFLFGGLFWICVLFLIKDGIQIFKALL